MSRVRLFIIVAGLAAAVLAASGYGYVFRELDRANDGLRAAETALRDTSATLEDTRAALADSDVDRTALMAENGLLEQDNADLRREKAGLMADGDALTGYLNGVLERNASLTDDLAAAWEAREELRGELVESEAQAAALAGERRELEGRLDEMARLRDALDADYMSLQGEHQRLVQAAGDAAELETRIAGLREEVAALEERRRPLLLAMERVWVEGFLCTGSMEPKLTCLDTATWMRDFSPEEIVVGAVITFDRRACRSGAAGRVAHRVAEVKVDDGVHYFWPKGDALPDADGCWVPHTAVDGYIIEVHKDTVPANAVLRDNVNAARAAYTSAWKEYVDVIEEYCGHREPQRCSVSVSNPLGRQAQRLLQRAQEASDFYSCWYANAAASRYPGHIPYEC